mgnify:CR=1 FL=1
MQENEIRFRQIREVSQVINDSFTFLKQEIKPISRIVLVYVLPFILLYAAAQVYFQRNVMGNFDISDPESLMANIGPFYLNLFFFMMFSLFVQSLLAGTYYSYIEAYIKKGKGNFQLSDISSNFFSNSLLALGAGFVYTIIVMIGVMLCLLPGIFVANTLSLVIFIFIFEKKGLNDSLTDSWRLVNSQWWSTFLINLLGLVFAYLVGTVISFPGMFVGVNTNLSDGASQIPAEYPQWYWILIGLSSVVTITLLIIPYTFQAFQYFNLKERMEPGSGPDTDIRI